jgi:uncharacterized protein YaaR (DUF327 family)
MDRIDSVGESFTKKSPSKKIRTKKPSRSVFSSLLHKAAETEEQEFDVDVEERETGPLDDLMEDITALGDALVRTPTLENVRRYRDRVKQFLKYVVAHVLEVEERTSGTNILKRKKYLMVNTVDQQLETLAREFLGSQKEHIDLLGRINEINGLLVDLLR